MNLDLHDHVVVVVGSAQGIGRAIASAFAAEGTRVVLIDRMAAVRVTAAELGELHGVRTLALEGDVTDYGRMTACAAEAKTAMGRVDHVVFAVAIGSGKFGFPFWDLSPADWPRVLEVNVVGGVNVAHAFAPLLVEGRSGTMTFLASIAGQIGSQTDPPYSASKAAIINFAQCAAKDLAPYGVRVNTLCPGMVRTALNESVWASWARKQTLETWQSYEDWAGEKVRRVVPLGRWQTPEDIAAMAVFLASARAANVTGQTVNVDGGFVMHW